MIYLAAPLFSAREREFNVRLKLLIPYPVYLPQEDGRLITDLLAEGVELNSAVRTIHQNDIQALCRSDVMVAVLDGAHVDSGVAFEIGYFHALGKPIIGLHTDSRTELSFGHNPMITGSIGIIVRNEIALLYTLKEMKSAGGISEPKTRR